MANGPSLIMHAVGYRVEITGVVNDLPREMVPAVLLQSLDLPLQLAAGVRHVNVVLLDAGDAERAVLRAAT